MTPTHTRLLLAAVTLSAACARSDGQQPPAPVVPAAAAIPAVPAPAEITLEDQFGRQQKLSALRGRVVVFVYGDRRGTDACKELGEQLHVLFHPAAKGQPPEKARLAPVAPLPGLAAGVASPDVLVVPVACPGKVPAVVKDFIVSGVKKASPEVVVLLDFAGAVEAMFGLKGGEPNVVVFDAAGRPRYRANGTPDKATADKLLQTIQDLRAEAAGVGK